jgi:hypothetical protein
MGVGGNKAWPGYAPLGAVMGGLIGGRGGRGGEGYDGVGATNVLA